MIMFRLALAATLTAAMTPLSTANAGRKIEIVPIETGTHDHFRGACGVRGSSFLRCRNLSSIEQNLTLNLAYQKIWHRVYVSRPTGLSNWTWLRGVAPTGNTADYAYHEVKLPSESLKVLLGPNESKEIAFGMSCDTNLSGLSCKSDPNARDTYTTNEFSIHSPEVPLNQATTDNRDAGSMMRYTYEATITIDKDRGAVLCSVFSEPMIGCGVGQITNVELVHLNGGRAF